MQNVYPDIMPDSADIQDLLENLESTKWHQQIIEKATEIASSIQDVKAIMLKGSLAKGEGDAFSDIDFYVVHTGSEETAYAILKEFLARVHEIGERTHYFTSTADITSRIIWFRPFIKFELNIREKEKAGSWMNAHARVLYDPERILQELIDTADKFTIEPHLQEIRNTAIALPSFCYITAGHLLRGEWITAMHDIQWVAMRLLTVTGWILGLWNEGARRAERRFPDDILGYYRRMHAENPYTIWISFEAVLDWYVEWLIPKFDEMNIQHAAYQVPLIRTILKGLQEEFQKRYISQI